MTYVMTDPGRPHRTKTDLARFVPDLAKALGGNAIVENIDQHRIEVDGFRIMIDAMWNDGGKVELHIREADRKWLGSNEPSGADYRFPSIRISVDRPMERLAADIRRRLIEPARAPAAKRREYTAKLNASAANLVAHAAKLRKRFPALDVRVDKDATYNGSFYRRADDGPSIDGRIYDDGRVTIDRLGTLSAEQFERVMIALYETETLTAQAKGRRNA